MAVVADSRPLPRVKRRSARKYAPGAWTRLLLAMPALLISLSVVLIPVIATTGFAFTDWNGLGTPKFIGLQNFVVILQEPRFWKALLNNLFYTALYVTLPMIGGLLFAVLLLVTPVGRSFFQIIFFLPVTIATAVLAQVWMGMIYSSNTGLIAWLNLIGLPVSNPLSETSTSLFGVLFVDMWQWWGYLTVIYLAALRQVDRSLIEAATIDGATRWQIFTQVLVPTIMPTVLFMLLMTTIWSFKVFDWIFIMTDGGPGYSSEVLGTLAYKTAFQQFAVGQASSYSLIMSLVGLGAIIVYMRIQIKAERN